MVNLVFCVNVVGQWTNTFESQLGWDVIVSSNATVSPLISLKRVIIHVCILEGDVRRIVMNGEPIVPRSVLKDLINIAFEGWLMRKGGRQLWTVVN